MFEYLTSGFHWYDALKLTVNMIILGFPAALITGVYGFILANLFSAGVRAGKK